MSCSLDVRYSLRWFGDLNSWILSCIRCSIGQTWHTELNLQILQPFHDGTLCRGETNAVFEIMQCFSYSWVSHSSNCLTLVPRLWESSSFSISLTYLFSCAHLRNSVTGHAHWCLSVHSLVSWSVSLLLWVVIASLLLPKCFVKRLMDCPRPPTCNLAMYPA